MSISEEDLKKMSEVFEDEAKKAIDGIINACRQNEAGRDYFKDTEKLLYSYPELKKKVSMDEEFLADPDAVIYPQGRSHDIVRYSNTGGLVQTGFDEEEYTKSVKKSMIRTRAEVARIERALNQIREDKYYRVIELKYFEKKDDSQEGYTYEDIAEILEKDVRTIRRNKNRLINRLKIYLFGADVLTKLT